MNIKTQSNKLCDGGDWVFILHNKSDVLGNGNGITITRTEADAKTKNERQKL